MKLSIAIVGVLICCATYTEEPPQPVQPPEDPVITSTTAKSRALLVEPPAPKDYLRPEVLINTDQLAELLDKQSDPKLVVVDARSEQAFRKGHLSRAQSIESDLLQAPESPPYFIAGADVVKTFCTAAGIHADSRVVIYDEEDGRLAARVWFTLHTYGHERVCILNGGLGKWKDEQRRVTESSAEKPDKPGTFEPAAALRSVCTFDELAQFRTRVQTIGKLPPTTLLDARTQAEYMGEDSRAKIAGHIPGAVNIEWSSMLSGKPKSRVFRSAAEIHAILRLAAIERDQKIGIYDQAGGRSSHLFFTLWLMGFEKPSNYVAGWREYGNKESVEVEK